MKPFSQKQASPLKMNIRLIFKLLLSPIHEHMTILVVERLLFLHQFYLVSSDIFAKFATTTSQRWPMLENDVWEMQYFLSQNWCSIFDTTGTSLSHWDGNILYCACGFYFFHYMFNCWTDRTIIRTINWRTF